MLEKTIKYTDYNGEEKTKTFYFNLSRLEITKLNITEQGGLKETIKKIVNEENNKKMFEMFESIVLLAYGEKGADGETFLKNDAIRERFQCHPAYDALMMQFIEGGEKALSDFVNAIIPKDWSEAASKVDRSEIEEFLHPAVN